MVLFLVVRCESALPAAALESLLVRPSRRVLEAALAALFEVTFLGALACASALPAAVLDFVLVLLLVNVFDALDAAFLLVTLFLAICNYLYYEYVFTQFTQ